MTSAEDIKAWLKRVGKNREWLAEKTLVSKGTVNGWLSTGKPIPSAKLALIEKLMSGEEEIEFELPPDFEKQLRAMADEMHKNLEDMVSHILQVTARAHQKRKAEAPSQQFTPVEPLPAASFLDQPVPVIGNIAAGALTPGDNIPYQIKTDYQLGKGEYVLQVEGKSMEPVIPDGSLVVMRKHTNGGYVNLLDECWKMCEKFHTNIVIMYDHVSCKNVGGLHGLFEDQARERGIHLIWIPHDVMDPRTVSRREMREAFSQYMVTVLNEKPLDPTLLDYEDALSW